MSTLQHQSGTSFPTHVDTAQYLAASRVSIRRISGKEYNEHSNTLPEECFLFCCMYDQSRDDPE